MAKKLKALKSPIFEKNIFGYGFILLKIFKQNTANLNGV